MSNHQSHLEEVFGFGPDELQANSHHSLTPKQEELLKEYRQRQGCGLRMASVAIGITVLMMSVAGFFALQETTEAMSNAVRNSFLIVIGLVLLIFIIALWVGSRRSHLKDGRVSMVEGAVRLREKKIRSRSGTFTAWYVTLGEKRLQVSTRKKFEAFDEGEWYRLYYVEHPPAHIILSVEEMYG